MIHLAAAVSEGLDADDHRNGSGPVAYGYDGDAEVALDLQPWEEEFGERINKLFWEFFDKSEDPEGWNRRWNIQRDINWRQIQAQPLDANLTGLVESFFAVESFLPDFAESGLGFYRRLLGLAHNHINWSYEELKHGRLLELVLIRSGARTEEQVAEFRRGLFRKVWRPPFDQARQMLVYAAYQERATNRNYVQLREVALKLGAEGAAAGLNYLARDEAFHHAYFRDVVRLYLEYDEVGTARDLVFVANNFRMPAQHLLPEPRDRIKALARNRIVNKRRIMDESILPTIKALGFRDYDELTSVAGLAVDE
jgi:acyl-[acyl-carrier-protein] desaturase